MIHQLPDTAQLLLGFFITLLAYILGKFCSKHVPRIPVIVFSMIWVVVILWACAWQYEQYMQRIHPLFGHLLGYVTVALAIPLAAIRLDDLPLKPLCGILVFASVIGVALPMGLAYLLHLSEPTIMAFATRALTTPVALNIAELLHSPPALVTLIVIVSGVIGAAFSSIILRNINDERASGLAIGLAAHAIGTAQAWQRGIIAGRYAALGMAINAILTSIWLPAVYYLFSSQ
ncbi:LrgB family protein [Acinetobacter qingfengensis]|uniref:Rhamnonate dehydratase n=1 Tax=Acinetobacter qingfengensis TaxID=1262585 RepID=A0A1E7RF66_9GAMM|nr:LrgB family protein [Acinetobacter qingfengensis]OEY98008.1 rhamnonate dehydratase [Acinetobacter qingfengensis]